MKSVLSFLALALLLPMIAEAQSAGLTAGARVRVTSARDGVRKYAGTITELRGDTLVVAGKRGSRSIAVDNVTALDVSTGRRTQVARFGLIGFGIGALGGFAIGYASYEGPSLLSNSPAGDGAWVGGTLGVFGLVTGAIAGALNRADHWVPAHPVVRASIGTTRSGGVSLGISRAF